MSKDANYTKTVLILNASTADNSTIVDDSMLHQTATVYGGSAIATGWVHFNGTGDYIEYPAINFGSTDNGGAIECEVFFEDYPASSNGYYRMNIVSHDNWTAGGQRSFLLQIVGTASSLDSVLFYAIDTSNAVHQIDANYSFSLNTPYKIGVSWQNGNCYLAVNDAIVATNNSWSFTHSVSTENIRLAKSRTPPYDYRFKGGMRLRISKCFRNLTQTATPFPIHGYQVSLALSESIAANDFIVGIHDLATLALLNKTTIQAGNVDIDTFTDQPVCVVIMPNQGTAWKKSTVYAVNDLVFPTDPITTPHYYKRINAGTSGNTEPTWPTSGANQCNDGAVTNAWQRIDALTKPQTIAPVIPA
jgi:hypothetical protein